MLFLVNICYDNSRGIIQKRTAALIQYNLFLGESDSVWEWDWRYGHWPASRPLLLLRHSSWSPCAPAAEPGDADRPARTGGDGFRTGGDGRGGRVFGLKHQQWQRLQMGDVAARNARQVRSSLFCHMAFPFFCRAYANLFWMVFIWGTGTGTGYEQIFFSLWNNEQALFL